MVLAYTIPVYPSLRISRRIGSAQNFARNMFGMGFACCPCWKITPDVGPYSPYLIVASRRTDSRQQWRHAMFSYSRLARRSMGMLARNVSVLGPQKMGNQCVSLIISLFSAFES
jgi:hypothetical protein